MITSLQQRAVQRGWTVIFMQANLGDAAAIALHDKLGRHEEVLHFDIPPRPV